MRTSELIALRKAAVEHSAVSPVKSAQLALALGAWATGGSNGCALWPRRHEVHGMLPSRTLCLAAVAVEAFP